MTKARDLGDNAQNTKPKVINAKGDLIVGTGSDAADRLAVSDNGSTLVADSSTTTGLRYNPPVASLANPVVNGGMDVWQRGTSFTVASTTGTYTADRWQVLRAASGLTVSRQDVSDSTNLPNIQYALRLQRDSGNTSTATIDMAQSFETTNSIPFAGKAVTLSYYARRGANYSGGSNAITAYLVTGTGTDQNRLTFGYTGDNTSIALSQAITTSWARYVITGTVPTTAKEMAIYFQTGASGTAGANDWVEITGVQIDVGTYTASTAPTFRRSGGTLAGELAACQRYYYLAGSGSSKFLCNAYDFSTTQVEGVVSFPVTMRIAPTLDATSGTNYYGSRYSGKTFNSLTLYQASTTYSGVYATTTGLTAGNADAIYLNNAAASVAFTSEL